MNIAVLITGQLRFNHNFRENINYFLSGLSDVNVDFFCTTWFEKNIDFEKLNKDFDFKVLDIETYNEYTTCFIKDYIQFEEFCLNYKNNDVEYNTFAHDSWVNRTWQNLPCIFHKIYRGYSIIEQYSKKNKIKYDVVIRLRSDCLLRTICNKNTLLETKNSNKLAIHKHNFAKFSSLYKEDNKDYYCQKFVDGWIDETMFYCNMEVFKKFSNIYFDFFNVVKTKNVWITHLIMKYFLEKEMIDVINPDVRIGISKPNDTTIFYFDYLYD